MNDADHPHQPGQPGQHPHDLIGSFALGALDEPERSAVGAHLGECAVCRTEADDIGAVAAALAPVDVERLTRRLETAADQSDLADPPPDLADRIRARIREESAAVPAPVDPTPPAYADQTDHADELTARRTRRRTPSKGVLAVAAAAVVVAGVGGGLVGRATAPEPETPALPLEAITLNQAPGATGDVVSVSTADLVPHTWGVELRITASGFDAGKVYRAYFRSDGRWVPAGEFLGTGDSSMACNLQAGVLRDQVSAVRIVDTGGDVVLRSKI